MDTSIEDRFPRLAQAWKKETRFVSSMTDMEASPHYEAIVALGDAVVPLLLRELEREHDYWFTALRTITREDPVPEEDRGNLARMTDRWLRWGQRAGRKW
jgi:hypothetical protein